MRRNMLSRPLRLLPMALGTALLAGAPVQDAAEERAAVHLGFPVRGQSVRVELHDGRAEVWLDGERLPEERLCRLPGHIEILDESSAPLAAVGLASDGGGFRVFEEQARVRLGVVVGDLDPALRAQLPGDGPHAVVITAVEPGLSADKAGLQVHDILRQIDDHQPADLEALRRTLAAKTPGERLDLRVLRGGEELEVVVELQRAQPEPGERVPFSLPIPQPAFGIGKHGRMMIWSSAHLSMDVEEGDLLGYEDRVLFDRIRRTLTFESDDETGNAERNVQVELRSMTKEQLDGAGVAFASDRLAIVEHRLSAIEDMLKELLERTDSE